MLPGGGGVEDTWCLLAAAGRKTGRGWVQKHILHVGHPLGNAAAHHPHPLVHVTLTPGPRGEPGTRRGVGTPVERDRGDAVEEPSPSGPITAAAPTATKPALSSHQLFPILEAKAAR